MSSLRSNVEGGHQSVYETRVAGHLELGGIRGLWSPRHHVHEGRPACLKVNPDGLTGSWLVLGQYSPAIRHDLNHGRGEDLGPEYLHVENGANRSTDYLGPDSGQGLEHERGTDLCSGRAKSAWLTDRISNVLAVNPRVERPHGQQSSQGKGCCGEGWHLGIEVPRPTCQLILPSRDRLAELGEQIRRRPSSARIDANFGHPSEVAGDMGEGLPVGLVGRSWVASDHGLGVDYVGDHVRNGPSGAGRFESPLHGLKAHGYLLDIQDAGAPSVH